MPRAFFQNSQQMSKELLLCVGPAYKRPSKVSVKVCQHSVEEGPSKARTKPASTRLQPSALVPASSRLLGACAGPPALLPLPLRPPSATGSPPPAGPPGRPGRPSAIVITHANVRARETKRGQASGSGIPVDKQY